MTCYCQQCGILTCEDSDDPLQSPFKLRNFKWCSVSSLTIIEYSSDKQRLWSDCAYAQADLRALLVPHTTLLEISCTVSYLFNVIDDVIHNTLRHDDLINAHAVRYATFISKKCINAFSTRGIW